MLSQSYRLSQLLEKMVSQHQGSRFMALNDLMVEVAQYPGILAKHESSEIQVLNQVLMLIEDQNSEVKNQAVKCLGHLIRIIREKNFNIVVNKLIELSGRPQEELRDIGGLALKIVVSELPLDGKFADMAWIKLVPKLVKQIHHPSTPAETVIEILSAISLLVTRFPQQTASGQLNPLSVFAPLLTHARPAVRKSAIDALAQCLPNMSEEALTRLLKPTIVLALFPGTELDQQRTMLQLLSGIARNSPLTLGPVLGDVMLGVLNAVKRDDNELQERALQTMENLVLQCPSEIISDPPQILSIAIELVNYDPNYTADANDDDDEDMEDSNNDDDEDMGDSNNDDDEDDYSDDEDMSFKVRLSAIKVITAIVSTRPELLHSVYKSASPVLISRFSDRKETVKLGAWSTYRTLIEQTGVYRGAQQAKAGEGTKGKPGNGTEMEDSPYALLKSQVPQLCKALLRQLHPKSPPTTLLAGFTLLQSLSVVLPGSLSASADNITNISLSILSTSSTTKIFTLHATVISLLSSFFSTHSPETFQSFLPRLTPQLLNAASQRQPCVTIEALRAFSALLTALKPVESGEWVDRLYDEVIARLKSNDTDMEVRERAEEVLVHLWLCASAVMKGKGGAEWDALMRSGQTDKALQVVTRVAVNVDMDDAWLTTCIVWVIGLLKEPRKTGNTKSFLCLEVLLRRYQNAVPSNLLGELVPQLQTFLTLTNLLLTHALVTLSILLSVAPKVTFPLVEKFVMPTVYKISHSSLLSGAPLQAMTDFFGQLVTADPDISTRVVSRLVLALEKSGDVDASPANVSKCISAIVKEYPGIATGIITEFGKALQPGTKSKEMHVVLSLMALGEIGRTIDMQRQPKVFSNVVTFFTGETEPVRTASSFAAGNIAAGNVHYFLPLLIAHMQNNSDQRLPSLHALKEVVLHCPREHMDMLATSVWKPLFEISDTEEEKTRNVAAACIALLTMSNLLQYLPMLQGQLTDSSASVGATVFAAIRCIFVENPRPDDNLLSPLIEQLMEFVCHEDITVRQLSLSMLNTAALNKPHIIQGHLPTLMPLLYRETVLKPKLFWPTHGGMEKLGDIGLEARKTTYETLCTILDTCVDRSDLHEFLNYVLVGLKDKSNYIKLSCHRMLHRVAQFAPDTVAQRLDDAAPELGKGLTDHKVKKFTAKLDLERTAELQESTLRVIVALSKISGGAGQTVFETLVKELSRSGNRWERDFKDLL